MNLSSILIGLLPTFVAAAWPAQYNLTTILSSQQFLATFAGYVDQFPNLFEQAAVGNYTILAPSDAAFTRYFNLNASSLNNTDAFEALLSYHILPGAHAGADFQGSPTFLPTLLTDSNYANVTGGQRVEVMVSGANVYFVSGIKAHSRLSIADIVYAGASGGFIHIIDTVLTMPMDAAQTATQADLLGYIQVAGSAPTESRILGALGPVSDWTVFAPSSNKIPVESLTLQNLFDIEDYCFVHSTVAYSSDLIDGMKLRTLNGKDVTITLQNSTIYVNAAKVIGRDYLISTGVLHLIDVTMNPNDTSARPSPLSTVSTATGAKPPPSSFTGISARVKAAIGAGAAIGAAAILGLIWWYIRNHRSSRQRNGLASKMNNPVELGSGEKGMATELCGSSWVQVHEIGAGHDEGRGSAELWAWPRNQPREIGVAL